MTSIINEIVSRSKPYQDADFLVSLFGSQLASAREGKFPIVLYGAGSAGRELCPLLRRHGIDPTCFCDSNPLLAGGLQCGIPIISYDELIEKHINSFVVITVRACREQLLQQLIESGFEEYKLLAFSDQEALCYYTHLDQWHWSHDDLEKYRNELITVYNQLTDQKSKDIFVSRIAMFVNGADYKAFCDFLSKYSDVKQAYGTNFQNHLSLPEYYREAFLQFNNDVLCLKNNELFVDCGAYTGDSTVEFMRACEKSKVTYKRIICFEPDPSIFAKLKTNVAKCPNIDLRQFGIWSSSTTLKFADSSKLTPGSTKIVSEGDILFDSASMLEITTTSIDDSFPSSEITIIKMDIEGAEIEALRGAANTITRCKPKLIISVYHKRNDIFEIPLMIHRLVPEYKLYLRHFSLSFNETTLFAIP